MTDTTTTFTIDTEFDINYWTIITNYHHHKYINQAAESVCTQQKGMKPNLVILNDDPDIRLENKILKFSNRHFSTFLEDGENKGQSARYNQGTDYAIEHGADWISILGADDWISDTRYLVLDTYIKVAPMIDVWYTGFVEIDKDDKYKYQPSRPFDAELIKQTNFIAQGTVIVNKKFAKLIQFDENVRYGEDWLWYNKLCAAGAKFAYIPVPTLYYRNYSTVVGMRDKENREKIREKIQQMYTI